VSLVPDDEGCRILHVDMDAFYASVELRDRPELRGKPVVVGGLGARGVVLSATYEARAFGVRSAMPISRARRLCPQAVFIPPRHGVYGEVSREVMAIFRAVTPAVEPLSLDEAFLDVSGARRRLGSPTGIAELIRRQVREQQSITCSVGVAPVKFVAKIASARCKPDGLLVVPEQGVLDFLHPLPVGALWGVGDRAEEVLARLGLRTVGDIAHVPAATLRRELGVAGEHLHALAWGRDSRPVVPRREEKSVGAEETFPVDVDDPEVIRRELLRLSGRTATALRAAGCVARTVTVKLRLASFKTITRSRTLAEPTDVAREIYATACALYEGSGLDGGRARLRLVGVRATGLRPATGSARQLAFGDRPAGWREAEQAMDRITSRFGAGVVRPAALFVPSDDTSGDRRPDAPSKGCDEPRILGNEPGV
jgi:DNA polymerase IV